MGSAQGELAVKERGLAEGQHVLADGAWLMERQHLQGCETVEVDLGKSMVRSPGFLQAACGAGASCPRKTYSVFTQIRTSRGEYHLRPWEPSTTSSLRCGSVLRVRSKDAVTA